MCSEGFLIKYFLVGIFVLLPVSSFAQIEITEIMYDHEGSDTGFEWIEIENTSNENIDISQWYFYENETHHGLSPDGFSILEPNERGLIVQNFDNIYSEYGNALNLIKSSFSLNNTGENLSISDENKIIQETIDYSSDDGATGNGNTLQWTGNQWIEAHPTPGSVNTTNNESSESNENESSDTSSSSSASSPVKIKKEDYYTATINIISQAIVHSPVDIEAYITHTKDNKELKLRRGVYYLNFGDGSFVESGERFELQHVYKYPGNYELVFEFYRSKLSRDAGEKPKVVIEKTLQVHEGTIEILNIDNQSAITIINNTGININLDGWNIVYNKNVYTFSRHSIITTRNSITIPRDIHNLGTINRDDWIQLRNQNNYTVYSFTNNTIKMDRVTNIYSPPVAQSSVIDTSYLTASIIDSGGVTALDRFLDEHPEKKRVNFDENNVYITDQEETQSSIPFTATAIAGVIALILAGVRIFHKNKKIHNSLEEEDSVIGEIELIE